MSRINRNIVTKSIAIGIMLLGVVHIAATFTPLIADKLAMLPEGAQDAFTYFSLMCGSLLVLGGGMTFALSGKTAEYPFVRKPYILTTAMLCIAGVLAVCYMSHNPFAWITFVLTMGLMVTSLLLPFNNRE